MRITFKRSSPKVGLITKSAGTGRDVLLCSFFFVDTLQPICLHASICNCESNRNLNRNVLHLQFSEQGNLLLSKVEKKQGSRNEIDSLQVNLLHDLRMNLHFPKHFCDNYSEVYVDSTTLLGEKYEWSDSFILEDLVVGKSTECDEVLEESVRLMKELVEVMKENQALLKQIEDKVLLK